MLARCPIIITFLCGPRLFQKKELGAALCDQVFYSLDLIEKDYFGLQYTDHNNIQVSNRACLLWKVVRGGAQWL